MEKEEGKEKSAFGSWQDPGEADEGQPFVSKGSRQEEEMQEGEDRKMEEHTEPAIKEYFDIRHSNLEDACGFTRVPIALILGYPTLRDELKITYIVLLSYAYGKNLCWPSASTIAYDLGCGVSTVYKHLSALQGACLIRQEKVFEDSLFISRGDYIRTNKHIMELSPVEIDRASFMINQLKKTRGSRRGILFVYKNLHKRSGFIMPNNVFIRRYKFLSPAAKITFLFLCYLADENINVNFTVISSALGKDRRTIERHMKDLVVAGLLEKERLNSSQISKVKKGDVNTRYYINDFSEVEVKGYLRDYNPQYLVCDTDENGSVDNPTFCDTDENNLVDNQYLVCDTDENDSETATQMRMDIRHRLEHKNKKDIEEERLNVLLENLREEDTLSDSLPDNESANLAVIIADAFNDHKSLHWYYKVACSFLEHCGSHLEVEKLLSETRYKMSKGTLKKSPGAYFTGTIKRIAEKKGIEL